MSTLPQDIADADGLLEDVNVLGITEAPAQENCTLNINKTCLHVVALVSDVTTLWHHLEQHHQAEYLRWAEAN
ncbi:hypothetical protein L210DRAFT_865284 [Boletus edulis BED1]|uniref:Uncharacterized protein n=1 Tax=Boletus edulis BED1 TaxID=1328754 RepID=A0AAD4BKQ7_BOLED|nr:hypothetical protein L210DRAFT_865284 [Boletus edulis BED1]